MSLSRELAIEIIGDRTIGPIRLGTVTAVGSRNDGGATYTVVEVDGRPMRCLASYTSPTNGHHVVWLQTTDHAVCLGPLL